MGLAEIPAVLDVVNDVEGDHGVGYEVETVIFPLEIEPNFCFDDSIMEMAMDPWF